MISWAERARVQALDRLVEAQSPDGSWPQIIVDSAMPTALFVIMLRTSGLICRPWQFEAEAALIRRLHQHINPDGGFRKYVGAPSSPLLSRLCNAAIRLALGEGHPAGRPAEWVRKNPVLDPAREEEARGMLRRSEEFCAAAPASRGDELETDLLLFSPLMVAHACGLESVSPRDRRTLTLIAQGLRVPGLLLVSRTLLHRLVEASWPAAMILVPGLWPCPATTRRARRLAALIRGTQDPSGGWEIGSFITMLNVMALARAGAPPDNPAIAAAHRFLVRNFFRWENEGATFGFAASNVLDTAYALESLVRAGMPPGDGGGPADRALRFLLAMQTTEGGFSFGFNVARDVDADTTAHVLRSFGTIAAAAGGETARAVGRSIERGVASMLRRQHRGGGFNCFRPPVFDGHRGSSSVVEQVFLDLPTPDVTARVVEALADCGMGARHRAVRKALRFLLRTQCADGSWWSRWWAGYLVGASFSLRAYAKLGLRLDGAPGDRLVRDSARAMRRAADFILAHQNPDGGWGETTASDSDAALAGIGPSTPLHTAHILSSLLRGGCAATDPSILRAMGFLRGTMDGDGRWHDGQATFSALARCAYYQCGFLNLVLPLDALNDYLQAMRAPRADCGARG